MNETVGKLNKYVYFIVYPFYLNFFSRYCRQNKPNADCFDTSPLRPRSYRPHSILSAVCCDQNVYYEWLYDRSARYTWEANSYRGKKSHFRESLQNRLKFLAIKASRSRCEKSASLARGEFFSRSSCRVWLASCIRLSLVCARLKNAWFFGYFRERQVILSVVILDQDNNHSQPVRR